jgi:hypothetical protein
MKLRHAVAKNHVAQPRGMPEHVQLIAELQNSRPQVIATIPFPESKHVRIGREDQRLESSGLGAFDDVLGNRAIAHHIELHPQAATGLSGQVLNPGGRHRAHAERNAGLCGGLRQSRITV